MSQQFFVPCVRREFPRRFMRNMLKRSWRRGKGRGVLLERWKVGSRYLVFLFHSRSASPLSYVWSYRLNRRKIPFFRKIVSGYVWTGPEYVFVRFSDFKCCLSPSTSHIYFSALAFRCFVSVVTAKDSSREGGRSDHRR